MVRPRNSEYIDLIENIGNKFMSMDIVATLLEITKRDFDEPLKVKMSNDYYTNDKVTSLVSYKKNDPRIVMQIRNNQNSVIVAIYDLNARIMLLGVYPDSLVKHEMPEHTRQELKEWHNVPI